DRLPGHDGAAVRGRRQVLPRGGFLVAARGDANHEAVRGRVQAIRSGPPDEADAPRLGQRAGLDPRRHVLRFPRCLKLCTRDEGAFDVPEAPQMQALAERVLAWLGGATFEGYEPLGFSGLKTYEPPPDALVGASLERVDRRAKYVSMWFDNGLRIVFHLSQAGRMDFEEPPKGTKPK